jgi:RNA polymerase-binding transcription factor DksA
MDADRQRLEASRLATLDRIGSLTRELGSILDATSLVAADDEHDPEGASTAFERQQVSALLEQAAARLADLDAALARIDNGTYGACERCGSDISIGRLEARPSARTCIRCATIPRHQEVR